jgi:cation:H+ antiporter
MIQVLLLTAGFILLIYGANLLVNSASALADSLRIPKIVIGLTIVAFGTSAPELIVNIFAAIKGSPAIALGNVAGSNLFNIMVILGVSAIIYPLRVKSNTTWTEIPLCLLSAFLVVIMANDRFLDAFGESTISRADGMILLLFFTIFLGYNIQLAKRGDLSDEIPEKQMSKMKSVLLLFGGLVLLVAGGRMIVSAAVNVATNLDVTERVIALTIVSAGTSLPELATSVVAALKRNTDIAIGNIVGSNIFNVFLILGATAVIKPVALPAGANLDLVINVVVSLLLFLFVFTGKGRRIDRWEGIIFLIIYLVYLGYLILG